MRKILNKTKLTSITLLIVLITSSIFVLTNISVQAQGAGGVEEGGSIPLPAGVTPSFEINTKAYLSFRPNPVGLNQEILVNMWLEPPTHVVRYHSDYKVIITNPSGVETEIHMPTYRGDSTAWFPWIVDQVGTWTIQFFFPGSYFPAGDYQAYSGGATVEGGTIHFAEDCYYKPTSTEKQELVVQEEIVYSWPDSELPTDYWTRPISFVNREWYSIAGNYPWHGPGVGSDWDQMYPDTNRFYSDRYDFLPYREAPETSHIVWRRQGEIGGVVGGEARRGSDIPMFQMTGDPGTPSIIYAGRCYQTVTKVRPDGTTGSVWQCYDLRTGEIYWEKTDVDGTPNAIEYDEGSGEVPGGSGRAFGDIGYVNLIYIGGGHLKKYNPFTGALTMDVEIPGGVSSGTYYRNCYALSIQNIGNQTNPEYRLINWTTAGAPGRNRYPLVISNTSYARSSLPTMYDFESGYGATYSSITPPQMGATYGTKVQGYNLMTGEQLWEVELPTEGMYSGSVAVADHGKVAILFKSGYFKAWDLATGNLAWTSDLMEYPWGEASFGGYAIESAYGMFYRQSYDGVYAFDWDTGDIVWHYIDPASSVYETPYRDQDSTTLYSFDSNAWIADGKLYTINNEHTPTPPITRGWGVNCIDIFTGERVWKLEGPWVWAGPGAIADGYLTITSNEGYMYVFGKGESETTVMGPLTAVPKGTAMMITGNVLDMSPDPVLSGTPCVSADSMSTQMEYLFFQYPIDGIWHNETITGVPVTLTAIAEDGIYVDIGTTTTDGYSGAFGVVWTPTTEGKYKIIASFAGDDSYGSSTATTFVAVGPAASAGGTITPEEPSSGGTTPTEPTPEEPTTPEQPTPEEPTPEEPEPTVAELPLISSELAIVIAVVAACIIGAVAYIALRRRK